MVSACSVLLIFAVIGMNSGQDFDGGFENRPFEYNGMNLGYGEASRQFIALKTINNREFERESERHRSSSGAWGLGEVLEKNVIFKGVISCHNMIGSDELGELNSIREYEEFKVQSVEIIDELTGEHYPYIREGDDFIAYNPHFQQMYNRRFFTVVIKHQGCVVVNPGCTAVTKYTSSYKFGKHHHLGFTRINLAVRFYEEECSLFRRIFNFWPFN